MNTNQLRHEFPHSSNRIRETAGTIKRRPHPKPGRRTLLILPLLIATALPLTASTALSGAESFTATIFAGMDPSVPPGQDFFRYANGEWLMRTEIPADRSSFGTDEELQELTTQRIADLIRSAAVSAPQVGSDAWKIRHYYSSFLDEDAIERKGIVGLNRALEPIAAIKDRRKLAEVLGSTVRADVDVLNNTKLHTSNILGLWVAQDLNDPARYSAFLVQGGLDMPDREYYLSDNEKMSEVRRQYTAHVARMLGLAGIADPERRAKAIIALETAIARAHSTRAESEDVHKGNNHWSREEFGRSAPGMDWEAFFKGAGLSSVPAFTVWQPDAVRGLATLVSSQAIEVWQDYLSFHEIDRLADYLPRAFVTARFEFHGRVLTGASEQRPRWKRAVDETNEALGEAVGKLYVERHFPASEKARAEAMVKNLLEAFSHRIDSLEWMTAATKEKAKAKLATLKVGVGYPDHWRDYSRLAVEPGDALGNRQRAERFEYERSLAKLGQSVDRGEWVMTPQTIDAVNLPAMNAMNFPAAILQPPYFDPKRPLASDYAATGSIIGHEISHSFDDQGAQFNADGRLANWWTEADYTHFQAAGAALVRQYDDYRPFPDLSVNGRQTLSENIADLAGLAAALDAFHLACAQKPTPVVAEFNGDQQFFVAYGQSWRKKQRDAELRRQLIADGHAPAQYRVDTVRNMDAWYAAFSVREGDTLYLPPAQRVRVW